MPPPTGTCHLCGVFGPLTFEHIPPQKAFNDDSVRVLRGNAVLNIDLRTVRGELVQGGAGDYTLCARCNSNTGSWYVPAYIDWAYQAMHNLYVTRGQASLRYDYDIYPLRVLKQVVCMFFSTNGPQFGEAYPDLQKFVLDRKASGLRSTIQIYAYLNPSDRTRLTGITSKGRFDTGSVEVISEMALIPVGYVMAFGNSPPPDKRLIDITFMAQSHYDDRRRVSLRLPVLSIYTFLPGDYRDRETAEREAKANRARGEGRAPSEDDLPRE